MKNITVGIIFGGCSTEHDQSIRATRTLYKNAIKHLKDKYKFKYFYLTEKNRWATENDSSRFIKGDTSKSPTVDPLRILDFNDIDVIYSTCMGGCGENGNLAGLADIFNVPIIGCGILPSALCLDKALCKPIVEDAGIPTVNSIIVNKKDKVSDILQLIDKKIGYPLFAKPTNLGTCAYAFKANSKDQFVNNWSKNIKENDRSDLYLIEQFIPNIEVRVFIYEDSKGQLHLNDKYVTTLKESALIHGGGLFNHVEQELNKKDREKISQYAIRLFESLKIKDYARIDFFIDQKTGKIYFNEANTQPFISTFNIELMEKDGVQFHQFLDMMIKKNVHK